MPLAASKPVMLDVAFAWDCPACEAVNFERGVPRKLIGEDLRAFLVKFGRLGPLDVLPAGKAVYDIPAPETVECKGCRARFKAVERLRPRT